MDLGIEGRVALITGAGQHMGRAMAFELAAEGARIAVNDLFSERAEEVAQEIRDAGGEAFPIVGDVTDPAAVKDMFGRAKEDLGPVDILVNNAGLPVARGPSESREARVTYFADQDPALWPRWIDLNYYGTLHCTQAALGDMQERNWGRIVSIISDAARMGEARQAVYSGAKGAILSFTKSVAREVAFYGITANCVSLGAVVHPEWLKEWGTPEQVEERLGKMKRLYPLARAHNRLGTAEDAAHMVTYLASQKAEWVTGQVISVNGGFAMP